MSSPSQTHKAQANPNVIFKTRNKSSCCMVTAWMYAVPTAILLHLFLWLLNLFNLMCFLFYSMFIVWYLSTYNFFLLFSGCIPRRFKSSPRKAELFADITDAATDFIILHLILQLKSFICCKQKEKPHVKLKKRMCNASIISFDFFFPCS